MTGKSISLTSEQIEMASGLTSLQRKFVINLVSSGMSQRQAYIAAGGKAKSKTAQDASASEILSKLKVRAFYDSLMNAAASGAIMTKQEALERTTVQARTTIKDIIDFRNAKVGDDDEGNPVYQSVWTVKNVDDIPDEIAQCIKSVKSTAQGLQIELYDNQAAKKQLSEMLGWNIKKDSESDTSIADSLKTLIQNLPS